VDKQKIGWILMLFAGGMLAVLWWVNRQAGKPTPKGAQTPTTQPVAAAPASRPATQPAAGGPTTAGATTFPALVAGRPEWQQDTAGMGEQNVFRAGSLDPASGYLLEASFVREGAAIRNLKLAKAFATDADKRKFASLDGDHAKYEQARRADPKSYRGHYSLLNPVVDPSNPARPVYSLATRRVTVAIEGLDARPTNIRNLDTTRWRHAGTTAVTQPTEGVEVRFVAMLYRDMDPRNPDARAAYKQALRLTKTYRIAKNDYNIQVRLKAENLTGRPMRIYVDQLGPTGVPREEKYRSEDDRFAVYGRLTTEDKSIDVIKTETHRNLQAGEEGDDGGKTYEQPTGQAVALGRSDEPAPVLWLGLGNKFFGSMMYLRPFYADRGEPSAPAWLAEFYYLPTHETNTSRTHVTAVRIGGTRGGQGGFRHAPALLLPATGKSKEMVLELFAGPKQRAMFSDEGPLPFRPLYKDLNYVKTINFRGCFCSWDALTLGMMWLLQKISIITLGNYGLAIMILVVLVRLVLHPLTKKSQVSMMNMQKLGPEMERLKKKYADDKETLQKEMMKFYKQQGATPLLGCAPMLLQMPIWIALWGSLSAAVELRHAAFLPIWLTDLAAPDAVFSWRQGYNLWLLGGMVGPIRSFNLLPLLLTVAMFLQTKFNPQMSQASASATPEQEKQKKMMQYMMPAMMLLFFYNAASGLTLYIMTSTFAGVAEQFIIRKHIRAKEAAEAAAVTTVKIPGKGPRGSRPKKPKGPFFTKRG